MVNCLICCVSGVEVGVLLCVVSVCRYLVCV